MSQPRRSMTVADRVGAALKALAGARPTRVVRQLVWRDRPGQHGAGIDGPAAYASGTVSRLDADFTPQALGPNTLSAQTLDLSRRRSTALINDNAHIAGAATTIVNNVVGPGGLGVLPDTGDRELNNTLSALFWAAAEAVDVGRETSLVESQRLYVAELVRVGEGLTYYPVAPAWNGYPQGPAIEVIDTDRMPVGSWTYPAKKPSNICQGVEFDSAGRRVAYHVLVDHPGENSWWSPNSVKTVVIPATEARLGFRHDRRRPGQVRGVPWTSPIVAAARMEDGFREAGLVQARTAASLAALYTGDDSGSAMVGEPADGGRFTDANGLPLSKLVPGMVGEVRGNGELKVVSATLPGPTFQAAIEVQLRAMAAGMNISYAVLARDYSKATFSATRAESLEDQRGFRAIQEMVFLNHTMPWYTRLVKWWVLSGRLTLTPAQRARYAAEPAWLWRALPNYTGWDWVNPQQEAQAKETELRAGITDPYTACATKGQHFEDVCDKRLTAEKYEADQRRAMGLPSTPAPTPTSTSPTSPTPPPASPDSPDHHDAGSDHTDHADQADQADQAQGT